MSVSFGIIGLAKSGRTTVFNALTKGEADTARHTKEGLAPHIGAPKIPEPRLNVLTDMLHPKKVVPVSVTYIDIGASVKDLVKDKGIVEVIIAIPSASRESLTSFIQQCQECGVSFKRMAGILWE